MNLGSYQWLYFATIIITLVGGIFGVALVLSGFSRDSELRVRNSRALTIIAGIVLLAASFGSSWVAAWTGEILVKYDKASRVTDSDVSEKTP